MGNKNVFIVISIVAVIVVAVFVYFIIQNQDSRDSQNQDDLISDLYVFTNPSDANLTLFSLDNYSGKQDDMLEISPASFVDLLEGYYQLNVYLEGYCPIFQEVSIVGGQDTTLNITLEQGVCN